MNTRLLVVACMATALVGCGDNSTPNTTGTTAGGDTTTKAAEPSTTNSGKSLNAQETSKWDYREDSDAMRGVTKRYAELESENELNFGFPYSAGPGALTIRKDRRGTNVYLTVSGQFICSEYSIDHVSVKFDSRPIQRFSCTESGDGSSGILFIDNEKRFISQLRRSHTTIIEADYYQHGEQQLTFATAGLKW